MQAQPASSVTVVCLAAALFGAGWFGSGCRSIAELPPLDFSSPGWETRTGQALWRPDRNKPEIVGDVVLARHPDGRAYVQFSKAIPIASAYLEANAWYAEFPPRNSRYSGRGAPPRRIVWLQLLRHALGAPTHPRWIADTGPEGQITLEDVERGERVQVHF